MPCSRYQQPPLHAGIMQRLCRAASVCIESFRQTRQSSSSGSLVQQLCAWILRLYKSVISSLTLSTASRAGDSNSQPACSTPTQQQQHHDQVDPSEPTAKASENRETAQQQPKEAVNSSLHQEAPPSEPQLAHMAVLEMTLQACKACRADQAKAMPALTMYLRACQITQEQGHSISWQATEKFFRSSVICRLE